MSAKVKEGLNYTSYGWPCLLLKEGSSYEWHSTDTTNDPFKVRQGWKFIGGSDEHLVEGAVLLAPSVIYRWE